MGKKKALPLKIGYKKFSPVNWLWAGIFQRKDEYTSVNPMQQVPSLVIDGDTLTQSVSTCTYKINCWKTSIAVALICWVGVILDFMSLYFYFSHNMTWKLQERPHLWNDSCETRVQIQGSNPRDCLLEVEGLTTEPPLFYCNMKMYSYI